MKARGEIIEWNLSSKRISSAELVKGFINVVQKKKRFYRSGFVISNTGLLQQ
jgi:hypothetical protein